MGGRRGGVRCNNTLLPAKPGNKGGTRRVGRGGRVKTNYPLIITLPIVYGCAIRPHRANYTHTQTTLNNKHDENKNTSGKRAARNL